MMNTTDVYEYLVRNMKTNNLLFEPGRMALGGFFYRLASGVYIFQKEQFDFLSFQSDVAYYDDYFRKIVSVFSPCQEFHSIEHNFRIDVSLLCTMLKKDGVSVHITAPKDQYEFYMKDACTVFSELPACFNFSEDFDEIERKIKEHDGLTMSSLLRYCKVEEQDRGAMQQDFYRRIRLLEKTDAFDNLDYMKWLTTECNVKGFIIGDRNIESAYRPPEDKIKRLCEIPHLNVLFDDKQTDIRHDLFCLLHTDMHISVGGGGLSMMAILLGKPVMIVDYFPSCETLKYHLFPNVNGYHAVYFGKLLAEKKEVTEKFISCIQKYKHVKDAWVENSKRIKELCSYLICNERFDSSRWKGTWRCFDEAYGVLAEEFLSIGNAHLAWECIQKVDEFNLFRMQHTLYALARKFKDNKKYDYARYMFRHAMVWAETIECDHVKSAIHFHEGEMFYSEKSFSEASNRFKQCLNMLPEHKKAQQYYFECLFHMKERVVLWVSDRAAAQRVIAKGDFDEKIIALILCDEHDCNNTGIGMVSVKESRSIAEDDVVGDVVVIIPPSQDATVFQNSHQSFLQRIHVEIPSIVYLKE